MSTKAAYHGPLEKVTDYCWRIPKSYKEGMRVDGLIFADENLIEQIRADQAPEQMADVWRTAELACFDFQDSRRTATQAHRWFGQRPKRPIPGLTAVAGDTIG